MIYFAANLGAAWAVGNCSNGLGGVPVRRILSGRRFPTGL